MLLLIKGKENYMHPMPIPFHPRLQYCPPVANGERKSEEEGELARVTANRWMAEIDAERNAFLLLFAS